MIAIVGASGVGKSTLLHVLGTLDRPDAGTLAIAGEDVLALADARRCAFRNRTLGFVFQFHHLLPEFSALENVSMPLLIGGAAIGDARSRARALLEEVGLAQPARPQAGRAVGRRAAAGGRRPGARRLPAGRCWPTSPRATSTGRPACASTRRSGELSGARGLTVVIVTHNDELARACDRVLRLEGGRLVPA